MIADLRLPACSPLHREAAGALAALVSVERIVELVERLRRDSDEVGQEAAAHLAHYAVELESAGAGIAALAAQVAGAPERLAAGLGVSLDELLAALREASYAKAGE